jgi:predicted transcriptional regulator of viral defense system
MRRKQFKEILSAHQIFSTRNIKNIIWDFDQRRLHERKVKWYLSSLKQWRYVFNDVWIWFEELMAIAGIQYSPSYVSLYTALNRYGVIPETTIMIQSITTRKTLMVSTDLGSFEYRSCPESRMHWYTILQSNLWDVQIATLEKAYLDILRYDSSLQDIDDFEWLRIIHEETSIFDAIHYKKLMLGYPKSFHARAVRFLEYIHSNA